MAEVGGTHVWAVMWARDVRVAWSGARVRMGYWIWGVLCMGMDVRMQSGRAWCDQM